MAPSNLQGLNIVHPPQPQNQYLSDQDLLAVPPFSDLSAQLDLWTNLNFQSDEPLISSRGKSQGLDDDRKGSRGLKDIDSYNSHEDELQQIGKVAEAHAHENVVTGTVIPSPTLRHDSGKNTPAFNLPVQPSLDIQSLLASFGIEPFQQAAQPSQQPTNPTSIAQLLSYHAAAAGLRPSLGSSTSVPSAPAASQQKPSPSVTVPPPPASKRARTARTASSEPPSPADSHTPEDEEGSTPLTAAEDKRRRNTAASARFRLKKKEREAALEKKAKELEVKVSELEKECEALRRENGWLKGLSS
ncbi:hypothetical protein BXZ70DRAFT_11537 [Cristinia sonorae]|uniref:BZIP domain-containing protein n=1 Tax=Cristinia sonorae TaxID=1940300 RepID=A0A8K0UZS8_9AGAR|nr:hypothetical protein BXZ70DRAFT_11537 [Cristinia sonorae]